MERDKVSLATLALAKAYTDEHGGGGGGTSNYNDLTHKPTVNGVEFKGTMTGETLGLVDAEDGKGLSTNDYTDADKTIVDGVTSALNGKVSKSNTAGLLKNDGTVDTTQYVSDISGKADLVTLAPAFSTSEAYTTGQYVTYDGRLYRFRRNHTFAAWNSSDVYQVTAGHDLATKQNLTSFDQNDFTVMGESVQGSDYETYKVFLNKSTTPTQSDTNPITSGAVYTALQDKADASDVETALADKVDKVTGKGLSTNDYDDTEKAKVAGAFSRSEQAVTGVKNFYYFDSVIAGETNASYEVTATGIRVYNTSAGTYRKATVKISKFPKNKDMILSWVMTVTSGAGSFGGLQGSTDGSTWTDLSFEVVDTYARKINTGNYNYIKFVVNSTRGTSETGDVTYSNIMLRFADESNADYVEPAMTNRELTEKVSFYREVRTGRFEFANNNLSSPVEVTLDTPWEEFSASSVVIILLQFEGGNATYEYVYSIASIYQTRFAVMLKNINNDVSASTRAARYIAFKLN